MMRSPPVLRLDLLVESLAYGLLQTYGVVQPPVVVIWGGIDSWKEERYD